MKCKQCDLEGVNHCDSCGGMFCDEHSAYEERHKEDYMEYKCLDCYDMYLTENGLY